MSGGLVWWSGLPSRKLSPIPASMDRMLICSQANQAKLFDKILVMLEFGDVWDLRGVSWDLRGVVIMAQNMATMDPYAHLLTSQPGKSLWQKKGLELEIGGVWGIGVSWHLRGVPGMYVGASCISICSPADATCIGCKFGRYLVLGKGSGKKRIFYGICVWLVDIGVWGEEWKVIGQIRQI